MGKWMRTIDCVGRDTAEGEAPPVGAGGQPAVAGQRAVRIQQDDPPLGHCQFRHRDVWPVQNMHARWTHAPATMVPACCQSCVACAQT